MKTPPHAEKCSTSRGQILIVQHLHRFRFMPRGSSSCVG